MYSKTLFLLTVIISLSFVCGFSQNKQAVSNQSLTYSEPSDAGFSQDRLNLISEMLREEIDKGHIPGAVAMIVRNGKIVFHESLGKANEQGKSMEKDAIFRIASQSKAITSTAVMMLWEKGLFQLDDPISRYIPEFKNPRVLDRFTYSDTSFTTVPAKREITIRDLLTHQSGLGYGQIDGDERMKMIYEKAGVVELFTTENITIKDVSLILAKLPLHHHPGDKYTYSMGLDVLGYFVEVMSGLKFDQFLRKEIFEPLGMEDTYFYLPSDRHDRLVAIQKKEEGQWQNFPNTFYDPDYPKFVGGKFFSGGAGLSSTAMDYARFLQMYLNGGKFNGSRILSRKTIETMMANQIGDHWGTGGSHYGLAFGVVDMNGVAKGGRGSEGTFDWGGYFNTQYFADPKEKIIGILMKQTQGWAGDESGWKFRQMVFAAVDD